MASEVVILGAGFVGQRLANKLGKCTITHRQLQTPESVHEQIEFRLEDQSTWSNLPDLAARDVVITFPVDVVPLEILENFHSQHLVNSKSVVIISTSGFFSPSESGGMVNEESPKSDKGMMGQNVVGRVRGEDWLLQKGATVLALSGIVGDTRKVTDWLKRGYLRNGAKLINVVYVKDIVNVILHFLTSPSPGERYIVNGGWYKVQEMCNHFGYPLVSEQPTDLTNMKISANKLLNVLPHGFKFFNVFDEPSFTRDLLKPMWDSYKSKHFQSWYGSVILFGGDDLAKASIKEEYTAQKEDEFVQSWEFLSTSGDSAVLEKVMNPKGVISFNSNASPFGIVLGVFRLFCFCEGDFIKASLSINSRGPSTFWFGFLLDANTRAIVSCTFNPDGLFKNYALFREETTPEVRYWTSDDTIVPERKAPLDLIPQQRLSLGNGCQVVMQKDVPAFPGYGQLDDISEVHTLYLPQGLTLVIPKLLVPKNNLQLAAWCERPDGFVVQLKANYMQTPYDSIFHNVEKVLYKV